MKSLKMRLLSIFIVCSIGVSFLPIRPTNPYVSTSSSSFKDDSFTLSRLFTGLFITLGVAAFIYFINRLMASGRDNIADKHNPEDDNPRLQQRTPIRSQEDTNLDTFRDLGIEPQLLPFVKDARRVGNVLYIQLKTIHQFDANVIEPVQVYHDNLVAQLKRMRGVQRTDQLENEDIRRINNCKPSGTCPVQVIRNLQLLNQFLIRGIQTGAPVLENINSVEHARNFLADLVQRNQPTSWMELNDIQRFIEAHDFNLSHATSCVVVYPEGTYDYHVTRAQQRVLRENSQDNPYHLFVVETGDATISGIFNEVCEDYKLSFNVTDEEIGRITSRENNKNHFYVSAIQRRQNEIRYFIVDTIGTKDHIDDQRYCVRDQYLCERVLDGRSSIDYRQHLRNYSEQILQQHIEDKKKK